MIQTEYYSYVLRGSNVRYNITGFSQSGRSMVEIIGALAIAGILSIGGMMGYQYAVDKARANRLMNDVETAYVSVRSSTNREAGVLTEVDFEPTCGYPMWTELIADEVFQTDIILAKNVSERVCNMILDMTEGTVWGIFSIETDTNYLYPLKECAEQNALVFSLDDVSDFAYTCDKECPANMMCNVNDECVCEAGFYTDENGRCISKKCDISKGPEAQTERFCCESLGGYWNYNTDPQMCGCEEGYFFNGKECAIDNWCSYKIKVPESFKIFEADCAYELKVPEVLQVSESDCTYDLTVMNTNGTITTTMTPGNKCGTGQYCVLKWTNNACTTGISTLVAGTTTTLHGRCATYDQYPNICTRRTGGEISMTPVSGKTCGNDQYCVLKWANEACSGYISGYNTNTTAMLYGRCASYDESISVCARKEGGEISMTPDKQCQEGYYCSISWNNSAAGSGWSCSYININGQNTTHDLYGVCLEYHDNTKQACPFKFE